jgi:hypothetical protein
MLFHISEEAAICRFEPRPSPFTDHPVVWAIHEDRLHNYLTPRDCPRVTYFATAQTTPADVARFLGESRAVVAVEGVWLERWRSCQLYKYHLPSDTFSCIDDGAGYHVSREPVEPMQAEVIADPLAAVIGLGVEVRFLENLWALRDAVIASTVQFSIIRMRNAKPRREGNESRP